VNLANTTRPEFLELSEQDKELKRFFDLVRRAGKLVVTDGAEEFVVECRRVTITEEARKRLTEGGPGGS
jgi:hypothetical protein